MKVAVLLLSEPDAKPHVAFQHQIDLASACASCTFGGGLSSRVSVRYRPIAHRSRCGSRSKTGPHYAGSTARGNLIYITNTQRSGLRSSTLLKINLKSALHRNNGVTNITHGRAALNATSSAHTPYNCYLLHTCMHSHPMLKCCI